jgi:hypothetical protein
MIAATQAKLPFNLIDDALTPDHEAKAKDAISLASGSEQVASELTSGVRQPDNIKFEVALHSVVSDKKSDATPNDKIKDQFEHMVLQTLIEAVLPAGKYYGSGLAGDVAKSFLSDAIAKSALSHLHITSGLQVGEGAPKCTKS